MGTSERDVVSGTVAHAPVAARTSWDPLLLKGTRHESRRWRRDALRRRLLAVADLAGALIALGAVAIAAVDAVWLLAFAPLWVPVAKLLGLYDRDHRALRHLTVDELPLLAASCATSAILTVELGALFGAADPSASSLALTVVLATLVTAAARALARGIWWSTNPPETTVVVGTGEPVDAIRRKIELLSGMHFDLAREVEAEAIASAADRAAAIEELITGADRLIVATPVIDTQLVGELVVACREAQVKLSVVSPLRGRAMPTTRPTQVADLRVLEYNTWDVSRTTVLIKRTMDIVISSATLLALAPLMALTALAVKLGDRGPVLFVQQRAGLGGRPFAMLKFRTMRPGAEDDLGELVAIDELAEPAFKLRADPRVTRVGRVLRRLSLDELPQLINVLRGEMSIVGPRPEQVELVERYAPEHRFRLQVKPGITGPMQVYGRGELSFDERLAVELDYVESLSIARDLRILLLTVPAALRGTGAF